MSHWQETLCLQFEFLITPFVRKTWFLLSSFQIDRIDRREKFYATIGLLALNSSHVFVCCWIIYHFTIPFYLTLFEVDKLLGVTSRANPLSTCCVEFEQLFVDNIGHLVYNGIETVIREDATLMPYHTTNRLYNIYKSSQKWQADWNIPSCFTGSRLPVFFLAKKVL